MYYFYIKNRLMSFDKDRILKQCNAFSKNTLMETLEIEFIDAGEDFLVARMPVNSKVHQPMGLLHGGASVALAESVGSAASMLFVNPEKFQMNVSQASRHRLKTTLACMLSRAECDTWLGCSGSRKQLAFASITFTYTDMIPESWGCNCGTESYVVK